MNISTALCRLLSIRAVVAAMFLAWTPVATAQTANVSPAQMAIIRTELVRRGLTEQEAVDGLRRSGIDVLTLAPADVAAMLPRITSVLDSLAAGKRDTQPRPVAPPTAAAQATGQVDTVARPIMAADSAASARLRVAMQPAPSDSIYGHSIFSDQSLEIFRTTDGARAPDSYVLDTGDRIRVIIFGASQEDLLLEINPDGYIQPTGVQKIFLRGVPLGQARRLILDRLAPHFSFTPDQFSLSIETARSIAINVFGESKVRGTFTLSALNTAFNALMAAGGPTGIGSIREIQVIRGNVQRRMDVYAFLNDPRVLASLDLQHNDVIFVPVAQRVVRIDGAIKRPLRYELTGSEGLRELIAFAGGINFDTYPDYVQVESIIGDEVVLREYRLSEVLSGTSSVTLRDGDVVRVRRIGRPLERYVEVDGAVFYGGRYDVNANPDLGALLQRAQIRPQAKTDLVFIERIRADESVAVLPVAWDDSVRLGRRVALEPRDRVRVFDRERYANLATLQVEGSVRAPLERTLGFGERIPVSQVLQLAGGLQPSAAEIAYVFRRDLTNPDRVTHIRLDLRQSLDFPIGAGDRLVIYDQRTYTELGELSVGGAVRTPMRTTFDPSLTVTDLLTMAGGTRPSAALRRVDIFRLRVDPQVGTRFDRLEIEVDSTFQVRRPSADFQLQPYDQVVVREIPSFDRTRAVQVSGQVRYPGNYALDVEVTHLSEVVDEAGGLTALADAEFTTVTRSAGDVGPISVDLRRALSRRRDPIADPIIVAGDVITIRERSNTVGLKLQGTRAGELVSTGATADNAVKELSITNVVYQGDKSARWYIERFAGGFATKADRWSVTVTDATGRVRGVKRRAFFFKDYPTVTSSSTVALRYELEKPPKDKQEGINWDAVVARTFQQVSLILSLIVLSRQL
jgi:protein involved in polysaccharide export with SLBB domain